MQGRAQAAQGLIAMHVCLLVRELVRACVCVCVCVCVGTTDTVHSTLHTVHVSVQELVRAHVPFCSVTKLFPFLFDSHAILISKVLVLLEQKVAKFSVDLSCRWSQDQFDDLP